MGAVVSPCTSITPSAPSLQKPPIQRSRAIFLASSKRIAGYQPTARKKKIKKKWVEQRKVRSFAGDEDSALWFAHRGGKEAANGAGGFG